MTLSEIIAKTRRNLNDQEGSIFKQVDIEDYINEGIDRVRSSVYFEDEPYLLVQSATPIYLPQQYHHLLAAYASARLFSQDERHYQSTTFMNEFEVKYEELITKIESGEITVTDSDGETVTADYEDDHVVEAYFYRGEVTDLDEGVDE